MRYIADVSGSANYRGPWPSQPSNARRPLLVGRQVDFIAGEPALNDNPGAQAAPRHACSSKSASLYRCWQDAHRVAASSLS